MPADEDNLVERGELLSLSLREDCAAGVGDNHFAGNVIVGFGEHVTDGAIDGFGLEHHTRTASER